MWGWRRSWCNGWWLRWVVQEKHEAVNEVMLLASINSPYVVKYYDSFMENDELHIVMEYCNR